jgi:hypothetical protein
VLYFSLRKVFPFTYCSSSSLRLEPRAGKELMEEGKKELVEFTWGRRCKVTGRLY